MQSESTSSDDILTSARNCRHYAMCKIDFLGTGVCASGTQRKYASFFPQGRMDLYAGLAQGTIPLTRQGVEIANGCDLCGKCDGQCYFVTQMRPLKVMQALKELVASRTQGGALLAPPPDDPLVARIQAIVGEQWADNDPAIAIAYANDPCALATSRMPRCVVLPGSREEVSQLLKLLNEEGVPWTARGNGSNILGFVLSEGVIIDMNRMKEISFEEEHWVVRIGAGVAAFDLQREAVRRGYRVHVAEPAALVCSSIMCSGILSLFSTTYGTCGDNVVDAEFVAPDGSLFSLNDKGAPNLFAFNMVDQQSPGICTGARIRLHPTTDDEAGVLVPFQTLEQALRFARECALRRIGIAIGVLGTEYVSSFISPTKELAREVKEILDSKLRMECMVLVIGDRYALQSVAQMGHPFLDQALFDTLNLGLASLASAQWLDLVTELAQDEPFSYLKVHGFAELAATALAPSPAQLAQKVDPDLAAFHEEIYSRPELTNLVWLNMFRITSSRIGRDKHFFPILMYLPLDHTLIAALVEEFEGIAQRHQLKHDMGFITPVDNGKRCIFEYDYFVDQIDADERSRMQLAAREIGAVMDEYTARTGTIRWIRYVLHQGYCRMQNLLYAH